MRLQKVLNKILNRSAIGDWRKDRFTGVWPRIEFDGKRYVKLYHLGIDEHGFHAPLHFWWGGDTHLERSYRWNEITVSMLELSDKAEFSVIVEVMM